MAYEATGWAYRGQTRQSAVRFAKDLEELEGPGLLGQHLVVLQPL